MKNDSIPLGFLIHAGVYLAVVGLCAALALSHDPPRHWFVWVAAGWGIGLGAHALAVRRCRARRPARS
ncbi:2TM domain-containing protein [Methyloceanibacter caenitepidi]|uniref:2TM domain-containing protein n=1 Tax=Methyloceanibacter caenitepidi TaxID=1384459 RepID=A0A0A8K1R4_9HYPH|nr:2TM domain-containing protein [Methyloceanibacter caenitepidi]BAQ15924.1 hypothetical protein GL4_0457 [Methyloceanibacter caenitepidi]